MRQFLTSGSVRGVPGNRHPYRDPRGAGAPYCRTITLEKRSDHNLAPWPCEEARIKAVYSYLTVSTGFVSAAFIVW